MKRKIVIFSMKRLSSGAKIFNYIIESLQSFKDIYIYNKQDFFKKKYFEQSQIYHNVQKNIAWINSLPRIFLEALKCIIDVSPKKDSSFVLGFINLLGLIFFLENEPNPLISTLPSDATVLIIS